MKSLENKFIKKHKDKKYKSIKTKLNLLRTLNS